MTKYLVALVLALLLLYGLFEARPLLLGPSLAISSPTDDASFADGIVSVTGRAVRATTLILDGAPLLADRQGNFSTTLTFPRGSSILTFVAADRFGRTVTKTRTVFVP